MTSRACSGTVFGFALQRARHAREPSGLSVVSEPKAPCASSSVEPTLVDPQEHHRFDSSRHTSTIGKHARYIMKYIPNMFIHTLYYKYF
jgi:hypothetical protein